MYLDAHNGPTSIGAPPLSGGPSVIPVRAEMWCISRTIGFGLKLLVISRQWRAYIVDLLTPHSPPPKRTHRDSKTLFFLTSQ